MIIAEIGVFMIGLAVLLIGKFTMKLIFQIGIFILKDIFFMLVFFNVLNSSFSFGLQIYSMTLIGFDSKELACDFIGIIVCVGLNALVLYAYFKYT